MDAGRVASGSLAGSWARGGGSVGGAGTQHESCLWVLHGPRVPMSCQTGFSSSTF